MPTDSPMPSPDINAPSPSSSSVSIEDLNVHNINYDTALNSDKYMMNSSVENSINDADIYVPTVVNNIKSYVAPDKYTSVQGMLNYIFRLSRCSLTIKQFNYCIESYDPASVNFPSIENQDQQPLTSQFPYDAPSPPPDETFAYSAFPNQTNVSYTNDVCIYFMYCIIIFEIFFFFLLTDE